MKIAIMTWFHYDRYGTVLQAVAMSRILEQMGHEAYVIDYFPGNRSLLLPSKLAPSEVMSSMQRGNVDPEITTHISGAAFDRYRDEHLKLTKYCATMTDLESLNEEFDAFICGSDRIWLPMNFDPHYYLDFVKDTGCMIAYAPSILDPGKVDRYVFEQMRSLIARFPYLSVREGNGRKYLDSAFSEKAQELADPTLLIEPDQWESLPVCAQEEETDQPGEPYLLTVIEGAGHNYFDASAKIASRLGRRMRIVPIHASDLNREGVIDGEVGPDRLIRLIRNADYICTDSYHVTLLALNFHKEFCSFNSYTDSRHMFLNQRLSHILEAVGLPERLYASDSMLETFIQPIDYVPVDYKLDALKLKSRQFLENTLALVQEHISARVLPQEHVLEGYSLCNGCGACQTQCTEGAIQILMDQDGFERAHVDAEKCNRCGRCTPVCPFRNDVEGVRIAQGRLLSYRDGEREIVMNASGGGLCSRLAVMLSQEGMYIAGCAVDENTQRAKHRLISPQDGPEALRSLAGSKYMQSEMAGLWEEMKDVREPIAFFGTPCQVAAARLAMKDRPDIDYVEIVCSGVPSYLLYEKYKKSFRGRRKMDPEHFELTVRYKQVPKAEGYIRVRDGSSERIIPQKKDTFTRVMRSREFFCDTCYDCRWRDTSCADLRIGDYRADRKKPDTRSDESSVIILTDQGQKIMDKLMTSGYWEGLHKRDIVRFMSMAQTQNPPKPVFYEEMTQKFMDDKVSMNRIMNEYIKVFEKHRRWLPF